MTYRELLHHLQDMNQQALNLDVTIYDHGEDEYFQVQDFDHAVGTDVIEDSHPILVL